MPEVNELQTSTEELVEEFFGLSGKGPEVPPIGGIKIICPDKNQEAPSPCIKTSQVVDCVVVPVWGQTADNKDFHGLLHLTKSMTLSGLLSKSDVNLSGATVNYAIIPGTETSARALQIVTEECQTAWGHTEPNNKTKPTIINILSEQYGIKSRVSIKRDNAGSVRICVVRPKIFA